MYGRISDPEMEPYPPRVWRDLEVVPGPGEQLSQRAGSMSPSQLSSSDQWMGVGFPHRAGRYQPGDHCFRFRVVVFVTYRRIHDPRMVYYPPWVLRDLGVDPRGNLAARWP